MLVPCALAAQTLELIWDFDRSTIELVDTKYDHNSCVKKRHLRNLYV